jgi:hypothetical protein
VNTKDAMDLPLQTRADVRLQPDTVNPDARTVEVVWSTQAPVRRRDPWTGKRYDEVLSLDPRHVDLSRLNAGAPLLDTHGAHSLQNILGVVERAWTADGVDGPEGRALVRFSEREDVEPLWRDVRAGIIRQVSVGYAVRAFEISEPEGAVPIWRAVDWQPMELSAVPVGADPAAGFRERSALTSCRLIHRAAAAPLPETPTMTQPTPAADTVDRSPMPSEDIVSRETVETVSPETEESPTRGDTPACKTRAGTDTLVPERPDCPPSRTSDVSEPAPSSEDVARRVVTEERVRIAAIYDAARKLNVDTAIADDLVRRGVVLEDARGELIDAAAERDRRIETRPHIRMGGLDTNETRRAAVETALLHRFDPHRYALSEPAHDWRGYSLIEMARAFLEEDGVRVRGLSRDAIATRALHTTSDFPQILAAVTNKTLRNAYEAAPRTFQPIARRATAADFKDIHRVQLGEAPQLEKVNETGEFKRGTMAEAKERYRVETYGKVIGIKRLDVDGAARRWLVALPRLIDQAWPNER